MIGLFSFPFLRRFTKYFYYVTSQNAIKLFGLYMNTVKFNSIIYLNVTNNNFLKICNVITVIVTSINVKVISGDGLDEYIFTSIEMGKNVI